MSSFSSDGVSPPPDGVPPPPDGVSPPPDGVPPPPDGVLSVNTTSVDRLAFVIAVFFISYLYSHFSWELRYVIFII